MTIKCKTAKYANGQRAGLTTLEPVRVASHTGMIDLPAGAWLSCRLASGAANGAYGIHGDLRGMVYWDRWPTYLRAAR
jgi:hypothetical protein